MSELEQDLQPQLIQARQLASSHGAAGFAGSGRRILEEVDFDGQHEESGHEEASILNRTWVFVTDKMGL